MRIFAVVADQVGALGRDVLGELCDEVEQRQNLEVTLGSGCGPVAVVIGKGPARLF